MGDRTTAPTDGTGETAPNRRARLDAARLYLIIEGEPRGRPVEETVRLALEGGVDMVQLRDKGRADGEVVATAAGLGELCDKHGGLLILNDRPDLALESGADGVHLGQDDVSVDEARALLGADAIIGISTHDPAQIAAAEDSLVDYLGVGPVHATPTKPGMEPVGEELVRHAAEHARRPFFAIGGIDASNAGAVVAAGAKRIAVIRAIRDASDPRAAAAALRAAVEGRAAGVEPR